MTAKEPREPLRGVARSAEAAPSKSSREAVANAAQALRQASDSGPSADWLEAYAKEHHQRLACDLDLVTSRVDEDVALLELGAAPFLLTLALVERGLPLECVDVDPQRFSSAIDALGLSVKRCDIESERLPFPDGSFRFVLFNELFEHLRIDPIFTLSEVHRVLAPGGTLMLSTPNLRSFRGVRNLVFRNQGHACSAGVYRQYEKLRLLGHMGHVREYTTREVAEFLHRVGFQSRELIFRGGYGRGVVGLAERLWPSMRPAFTLLAERREDPA